MNLAVICPLSRNSAQPLLLNIHRQSVKDFALIVIESKAGIGASIAAALRPRALVKSDAETVGAARNLGIEIATALKCTHIVWFDDDDYYGPGYLNEAVDALASHRIVGKYAHFTALASRNVVLRNSGDLGNVQQSCYVSAVPGCTLAHEIWDGMPRFDEGLRFGEDTRWCADAIAAGERIWATTPFHFCYLRRGFHHGHTFPGRDEHLLAFSRGETYDVGAEGPNMQRLIDSGDMAALLARAALRPRVTLTEEQELEYERLTSPPVPPEKGWTFHDSDGQ